MKNLFPNSSITVTSDFRFQPLAYAAQQDDPILIQEMEMEGLKKLHYYPPLSRRFGKGVVASEVSLGGWTIGWRDVEFKENLLTVQWSEGFSRTSIWYLISDDKAKAQEFFEAVTSRLSLTRDAILVFDQGYWQPDHGLWESVQGVSLLFFFHSQLTL
jgi:transitional endoplasmic reticulum ATPase